MCKQSQRGVKFNFSAGRWGIVWGSVCHCKKCSWSTLDNAWSHLVDENNIKTNHCSSLIFTVIKNSVVDEHMIIYHSYVKLNYRSIQWWKEYSDPLLAASKSNNTTIIQQYSVSVKYSNVKILKYSITSKSPALRILEWSDCKYCWVVKSAHHMFFVKY